MNTDRIIKELLQFKNDVIDGRYPQPTAMGPGRIDKSVIKSKTITSNMIDVSNLQSVSTKTGTLSVDGAITVGTDGSIASGKTGYTDNVNPGFWLGVHNFVAKMNIGGSTYGIDWNGTKLVIKGEITATTGKIGGWDIGTTDLTTDTAKTGMASTGSYRLWVNASNAADLSTAVFSVNSSGLLKSTSANIGGWTIDANGLYTGSSTTERGISSSTSSNTFYAGGGPSSAPFRVSKEGKLTASDVVITGGTLSIGTAFSVTNTGKITASDISITGGSLNINNAFQVSDAGAVTATSATITGTVTANAGTIGGLNILTGNTGLQTTTTAKLQFGTGDYLQNDLIHFAVSNTTTAKIEFQYSTSGFKSTIGGSSANDSSGIVLKTTGDSAGTMTNTIAMFNTNTEGYDNSIGLATRGSSGTVKSSFTIRGDGTVVLRGGTSALHGISLATASDLVTVDGKLNITDAQASNPGNTAWASRGFSADGGGYIQIYIGGTAYKIPTYA